MKNNRKRMFHLANMATLRMAIVLTGIMAYYPAFALTNTWKTASGTNDWFTGTNWSAGTVPTTGDVVIITNANIGVVLTNTTDWLQSFTISNRATLIFSNWDTTLRTTNVEIQNNAKFTLPAAFTNNQMSNRVYVVCTNFILRTGGQIDTAGRGYRGSIGGTGDSGNGPGRGLGPGTGNYPGGGAGHGGRGGDGQYGAGGGIYDPTNAPIWPGSGGGGGSGGSGGGAVWIDAGLDIGSVTIEGTINANGTDAGVGGGGSGGSIYITCRTFGGSTNGLLTAKGGKGASTAYYGANAGGGRIAVVYNSAAQIGQPATVRFNVWEGTNSGCTAGDIGTLYIPDTTLLTTNWSNFEAVRIYGVTNLCLDALVMTNARIILAEPRFNLTVTNTIAINTSTLKLGSGITPTAYMQINCDSLMLTNTSGLYIYSGPTNAGTTNYGGRVAVTNDIVIASNSWICPASNGTNGGSVFFTAINVTINAGGGFNANGLGYAAGGELGTYGSGPGGGTSSAYYGGGGGYGGKGGNGSQGGGGGAYPWTNAPLRPGSGGGAYYGGAGGGLVWVEVAGTLVLDGTIKANGNNYSQHGGGGSGGGIFIIANKFRGATSGQLSAYGGNGYYPQSAGGGGGRIAVWHHVSQADRQTILADPDRAGANVPRIIITNNFTGTDFSGSCIASNGYGQFSPSSAATGTVIRLTVPPPRGAVFITH